MALAPTGVLATDPTDDVPAMSARGRHVGAAALGIGLAGCAAWLAWRLTHLDPHPVALAFLVAEIVGIAAAVAVSLALCSANESRSVFAAGDERDCHRFAYAVADLVGRTRSADLHRDVRTAVRAAPRWRPRDRADAAIAAVLAEGPRRLVLVVAVALGLLVGVAPFPLPPWWAIAAAVVGYGAIATSHVLLGRRRLRFGDRQRWSYGAIGEIVSRDDVAGHAPRSWTGALGVAVGLCLAIALRGMSDRWTHGLPAMDYDQRMMAFAVAIALVLGAINTIRTSPRPLPTDALVARRLEEATARQSLLAAAVCVGLVGLLAGTMPGAEGFDGGAPVRVADDSSVTLDDGGVARG